MQAAQIYRNVPEGQHRLPDLPYAYNALEPLISEESLRIHHDILHRNYVENLNKTELKLAQARKEKKYEEIKPLENDLAFNGSGHLLHSVFWTMMAPKGRGEKPGQQTFLEINLAFGSLSNFVQNFSHVAGKVEGSGWAVLIWMPTWGRVEILMSEKHQNLTQWGGIPILVLDVWEHAYYLDYKNRREDFIRDWWNFVNWSSVEWRLVMAKRGQIPLSLHFAQVFLSK